MQGTFQATGCVRPPAFQQIGIWYTPRWLGSLLDWTHDLLSPSFTSYDRYLIQFPPTEYHFRPILYVSILFVIMNNFKIFLAKFIFLINILSFTFDHHPGLIFLPSLLLLLLLLLLFFVLYIFVYCCIDSISKRDCLPSLLCREIKSSTWFATKQVIARTSVHNGHVYLCIVWQSGQVPFERHVLRINRAIIWPEQFSFCNEFYILYIINKKKQEMV